MSNSNNVIQFQPGQVPAHIAQARAQGTAVALNANASAGITGGWAYLGYKGRNWRLRFRGDDTLLQASAGTDHNGRPLPETPVQSLDVLIVGIANGVSKQFYMKNYAEGDDNPPDCFSVNGVTPDRAVEPGKRQNDNCALCPQNRFGSRVTDNGKKAKACSDRRRVAIVPDGDPENEAFGGPMMLNMSQSSLANLDRYCRELQKFGTDVSQVRTRLSFNLDVAYPEIVFTAAGWIEDPAQWQIALDWSHSNEVHRMLEEELDQATNTIEETPAQAATRTALAAPPPTHVQPPQPQAQVPATPPPAPPQARPASPFGNAAAKVTAPGTNGATAPTPAQAQAPKRGPGRPPGSPNKAAPAQAQAPAQADQGEVTQEETQQETPGPVIQGAPADMEDTIDSLLK